MDATPPLALSDSQLEHTMRLAQPLHTQSRDAFLRLLAHEFRGRVEIGDGELFRVAREIIKSYKLFDAPEVDGTHMPRWSSRRTNAVRSARASAEG
jgi:hypothetical protein